MFRRSNPKLYAFLEANFCDNCSFNKSMYLIPLLVNFIMAEIILKSHIKNRWFYRRCFGATIEMGK